MADNQNQKPQEENKPAPTNTGTTNAGGAAVTGNDPAKNNPNPSPMHGQNQSQPTPIKPAPSNQANQAQGSGGGVRANAPDKGKENSPSPDRDKNVSRTPQTRNTPTVREVQQRDLERQQHVSKIMGGNAREGEKEVQRQAGRDPNTVIPSDEAGEGNPSVEDKNRIRTKEFRDSEDTTLQETARDRDLTNGRQQTSDSPYRRDMIQENMPRIPPSLLGTAGRRVDTPESIAMRQDDRVYEAMRPPSEDELFTLGVHPDQNNEEVIKDMERRGVRRQKVDETNDVGKDNK